MISLLAWAESSYSTPSPLPPLSERTRSGAWPIGLLPHDHLAADLTAVGVTYDNGVGYAINGTRSDALTVGRLGAEVLEQAARALDGANLAKLGAPSATAAMRIHEAQRAALRATALDIRRSARAAGYVAAYARGVLPSGSTAANTDVAVAVDSFLAQHDGARVLLRPDLWHLYETNRRPGGLTKGALNKAASARWGQPRKLRGDFVYRPASSSQPSDPLGAPDHE